MFVARANKVEGTMSWCLGTNEILASYDFAKGRTRALWDRHLDSSQFFVFYYGYRCLGTYTEYLHDSNALYSDAAV